MNFLIPVFNDWEAVQLLLEQISEKYKQSNVYIINDNSTLPLALIRPDGLNLKVIHLVRNMGHQRAIACGIAYAAKNLDGQDLIILDADGEDRVEDIEKLINESTLKPNTIVFARRKRRSEGIVFKVFYALYQFVFKMLTGKNIDFGNFSFVPGSMVKKLSFLTEIWNNFPGGVIKSKLNYSGIPTIRGNRLAGKSQMNFVSLIQHGLSAVSVFLDVVSIRILIAMILAIGFSAAGLGIISVLLISDQMQAPPWTSTMGFALLIVLLQGFFISLFLVFSVLNYRTNRQFIPNTDALGFIEFVEELS